MGVGFTLIVPLADGQKAKTAWRGAQIVGWIERREHGEPQVVVHAARD